MTPCNVTPVRVAAEMGKVNARLVKEGHVEMIIEELVAGRPYTPNP